MTGTAAAGTPVQKESLPVVIDFKAGASRTASTSARTARYRWQILRNADAELQDVNGDGRTDLVVQINTSALELTNGDVRAYLTGKLFNGMPVIGVDSIRGVR